MYVYFSIALKAAMSCEKFSVHFSNETNPYVISLVPLCSYKVFRIEQGWFNLFLTTDIVVLQEWLLLKFRWLIWVGLKFIYIPAQQFLF